MTAPLTGVNGFLIAAVIQKVGINWAAKIKHMMGVTNSTRSFQGDKITAKTEQRRNFTREQVGFYQTKPSWKQKSEGNRILFTQ